MRPVGSDNQPHFCRLHFVEQVVSSCLGLHWRHRFIDLLHNRESIDGRFCQNRLLHHGREVWKTLVEGSYLPNWVLNVHLCFFVKLVLVEFNLSYLWIAMQVKTQNWSAYTYVVRKPLVSRAFLLYTLAKPFELLKSWFSTLDWTESAYRGYRLVAQLLPFSSDWTTPF